MLRIITANVNVIRSAMRKGFYPWLSAQDADFICLQELRAKAGQLTDEIFHPPGYHFFQVEAEKPGYSGVGIYTRHAPDRVQHGIGWKDFDSEGRYVQVDVGKLSVVSLYVPSGSSGDVRQQIKYDYLERLKPFFKSLRRKRRQYIICADWNIAHREIDLRNWKSNQKNSGFLPDERAWLDWLYDDAGYVDVFRRLEAGPDQYTWWSNRGQAWAKNVGWRLDYQVVTPKLAERAAAASIYTTERFSDHAPLTIDYDINLESVA